MGYLDLQHMPHGNAAGTVKTLAEVKDLSGRSRITRLVVGSVTKERREEDRGDIYYFDPKTDTSIHSMSLANVGLKEFRLLLPSMARSVQEERKGATKLWVSVVGFSPGEVAELVEVCNSKGADGVEINLGYPDWDSDGNLRFPFLEPRLACETLAAVKKALGKDHCKVGVKLGFLEKNPALLQDLAEVFIGSGVVDRVIASDCWPAQALAKEDGTPALAFRRGTGSIHCRHYGGLGGAPLRSRGLWTVSLLRRLLPAKVEIIGVGGILNSTHVKEYLDAGANGFQCGTAFRELGVSIFHQIEDGLQKRRSYSYAS